MTTSRRLQLLRDAALGGALAIAALAAWGPGSARAQDNDNSIWNLDQRVYRGVMHSLGLRDGTEDSIEYRERSPLVVPPTRNLPPPQSTASARNPAWPKDPDQQRREVKRKAPTYVTDEGGARLLLPSQLDPTGSTPPPKRAGDGKPATMGTDPGNSAAPSALGYFGGLFSLKGFGFGGVGDSNEEVGVFTTEPPRTSLTAPPAGYQTPSSAQPYGFVKRPDYDNKPAKSDPAVGQPGG